MAPETPLQASDFGIAEVFGDAFSAFKVSVGTHVAFTALFIFGLVVTSCLVGCGMSVLTWGAASAFDVNGTATWMTTGVALLLYSAFFAVMLLAMSMHQAFTLDVTVRTLRGESTDLSSGLRAAGARLASHFGFAIVRFGGDMIAGCVLFGAVLAIGGFDTLRRLGDDGAPSPEEMVAHFGELALFFALAYALWIVWVIALRGFIGLAPAAIQIEGRSPVDGISRGVRLLEGRRMQFVGMRIVWGIGWFVGLCLLYAPMVLIILMASGGGDARAMLSLLMIPYVFFFYFAIFLTYGFDSALEAAFYTRLVPRRDPTPSVADVFA